MSHHKKLVPPDEPTPIYTPLPPDPSGSGDENYNGGMSDWLPPAAFEQANWRNDWEQMLFYAIDRFVCGGASDAVAKQALLDYTKQMVWNNMLSSQGGWPGPIDRALDHATAKTAQIFQNLIENAFPDGGGNMEKIIAEARREINASGGCDKLFKGDDDE